VGLTIVLALRGVARTDVPSEAADPNGPLIGPRVRTWYRGLLAPFEERLARSGWSPDTITYAQLVVSVLAGWAFAIGAIFVAGWLTVFAGTLDILDGGLARRRGVAGPRGALVDSVVDRWAEFATFFGLGLFFRQGWMLGAVAFAAFGSQMVSYTRARAEGLGLDLATGRAQRPERYVVLGCGAWMSSLVAHLTCPLVGRPSHVVLELAVLVLAALSTWTAVQRLRHAAAALGARS
jgi:phosphatidylglycerophosphate synthase